MASLTGNWKSFAICFDIHGAYADKDAVRAFLKFVDHLKPVEKLCGGDVWDFAALRKGASEEEKRESLIDDYFAGMEFLKRYKPDKLTLGNHCQRSFDWASGQRGPASDLALGWVKEIEQTLRGLGTQWVPYGKRSYLPVGNTSVCVTHGCAHGKNAAEKTGMAFASIGSVFLGHCHAMQYAVLPTIERRWAAMGGCLCQTDRDYNRSHLNTLAQENGWIWGQYNNRNGEVLWSQVRRIGNEFPVLSL